MFSLFWNFSAALNGYMRFYMPTNRAVDWLRTPRGLKWAIPVALVTAPTYLFAMSVCATIIDRGGPGWLNVLVLLFAYHAIKFACVAVVSPILAVASVLQRHRTEPSEVHATLRREGRVVEPSTEVRHQTQGVEAVLVADHPEGLDRLQRLV